MFSIKGAIDSAFDNATLKPVEKTIKVVLLFYKTRNGHKNSAKASTNNGCIIKCI